MPVDLSPADRAKFSAAKHACSFVESGMRVGLGTGTTAAWLVRCLGEMVQEGELDIIGVPTSSRTAVLADEVGIRVASIDEAKWLDVTIDGADEIDQQLHLIKGGGGALLQEKIVATASDRMIVISDPSKEVLHLGAFPLPIEVVPFGWQTTRMLIAELLSSLESIGRQVSLRMDGNAPFVTDEQNYILDLHLTQIKNAPQLALALNQIPGVIENGLFVDICDVLVIGHPDGQVEVRDINKGTRKSDKMKILEDPNAFADL